MEGNEIIIKKSFVLHVFVVAAGNISDFLVFLVGAFLSNAPPSKRIRQLKVGGGWVSNGAWPKVGPSTRGH